MATFLRPGAQRPSAFGISFSSDRDTEEGPASAVYNQHEQLALQEQRKRLPIARHRNNILFLVEKHATTVLVGETGCGKTTQIPQFLVEAGWGSGGRAIACTQPRRVAAITVANRVAEERGSVLGREVGYSIRFEDISTQGETCIKYCTDGVLLREMMEDPLLSAYSVVMVDEAHERSLATDLLLGLLKKVGLRRPDLRIIVASATLQARRIADFFDTSTSSSDAYNKPALLTVEGRAHNVQVHYLKSPASDYVRTAVNTASDLHKGDLPGDILIFLTGQEECEAAVGMLEEESRRVRRRSNAQRLLPVPLYAGLPYAAQLQAFEAAPRGYRKVVVATNIAETSLTLEGVVFVVDSCFAKQAVYNPLTGLQSLMVAPISRASASQRAGRAGRVRPGHCLRLCTEQDYLQLPADTVPEIQRSELATAVVQLKALGVDNMMSFDWLAAPPAEAMVRALELLHALGALGSDARLTAPLGQRIADLPLDPRLAKALLASEQLGCSEEVVTLVAMLSVQSVWYSGNGQHALDAAKAKFAVGEGDLIAYLNIWSAWQKAGQGQGSWAHRHCLNHRTLLRTQDIRTQLCKHLRRLGIVLASSDGDVEPVQRAMAVGLFDNAVQLRDTVYESVDVNYTGTDSYRLIRSTGADAPRLRIHSGSVLFRTRPQWLLFWKVQQGPKGWYDMQDLLAVEPQWLPEAAPHMFRMTRTPA